MRRAATITAIAAALLAGCGGGGSESGSTPAGSATAGSSADGSKPFKPKHSKGGPKSANLPSKNGGDNAITTKTQR